MRKHFESMMYLRMSSRDYSMFDMLKYTHRKPTPQQKHDRTATKMSQTPTNQTASKREHHQRAQAVAHVSGKAQTTWTIKLTRSPRSSSTPVAPSSAPTKTHSNSKSSSTPRVNRNAQNIRQMLTIHSSPPAARRTRPTSPARQNRRAGQYSHEHAERAKAGRKSKQQQEHRVRGCCSSQE